MASTLDFLKRLADHNVEFVVVGGLAGTLHGSSLVTEDVDLCIPFSPDNLARILDAIGDANPRLRMVPDRPPLGRDPMKLADFKKFQQEIEDIALTLDNTPAQKMLFEQAAPLAKSLASNITRMIDAEAQYDTASMVEASRSAASVSIVSPD